MSASVGLSIVVPSFLGRDRLEVLIADLLRQDASRHLFELIVVTNGPDDGSRAYLDGISKDHPDLNIRVLQSYPASAARARNIGISAATMQYVTFVDDDDRIETQFVSSALSKANPSGIVVMPFREVNSDGSSPRASALIARLQSIQGKTVDASAVSWVLGFNAAKVLPLKKARLFRYDTTLGSGEDVVYFANFLSLRDLQIIGAEDSGCNAYVRTLRIDSISRSGETFKSRVQDRLECVAKLQRIPTTSKQSTAAISELIDGQLSLLKNFVETSRVSGERLSDAVVKAGVRNFPWESLQIDWPEAKALVISYCFPPFSDPSATVMAKRIAVSRDYVDAISADMSDVRSTDNSLKELINPWVRRSRQISCTNSFSSWEAISDFAKKASKIADKWLGETPYRMLYSRSMWSASHVAAAIVKIAHFDLKWIAEFSDPMSLGIDGELRSGAKVDNSLWSFFEGKLASLGIDDDEKDNHFRMVEMVTLLYADELLFTNEHQAAIVLSQYSGRIQEIARPKVKCLSQPTLSTDWYSIDDSLRLLPNRKVIRIGYFGSFYSHRGVGEILSVLKTRSEAGVKPLEFHVFTQNWQELEEGGDYGFKLLGHPYVPFLTFLNLASQFDVLFVNDSASASTFVANPFLPSKLADYLGAGVPIWGHLDEHSNINSELLHYCSRIGESRSIFEVLKKLDCDFD